MSEQNQIEPDNNKEIKIATAISILVMILNPAIFKKMDNGFIISGAIQILLVIILFFISIHKFGEDTEGGKYFLLLAFFVLIIGSALCTHIMLKI